MVLGDIGINMEKLHDIIIIDLGEEYKWNILNYLVT